MAVPSDVKNVLTKVFQACKKDQGKLTNLPSEYDGRSDERAYTVQNLETVACNHLFDDNFCAYGVTELEGCTIRYYFSAGAETYDFILDLRTEFPDFFKHPESREYLDIVNSHRRSRGL
ncbi:MAG: hypothetical protein ABIH37_00685 [archaeon]